MKSGSHECHLCSSASLQTISDYGDFRRVTSDSKPWPKGGQLLICSKCSGVQKSLDAEWTAEVGRIYDSYTIYHQGFGREQSVFDQNSGASTSRSTQLLERLVAEVELPPKGKLLDVGCGNGAFLRAFSVALPSWSLRGTELNAKYQREVESIAGVAALHVGEPGEAPGNFDLITLIHVLEHIPNPQRLFSQLSQKLELSGSLLIEVPSFIRNPFDLLIADHITHFSEATLRETVSCAGFEIESASDQWVPKELTLVAKKGTSRAIRESVKPDVALGTLLSRIAWLREVRQLAKSLASSGRLGLFGTSIASTWLFEEVEGNVTFFADEDRNRTGRKYMDRPVYLPEDAPDASDVLLALPPDLAESVKARLEASAINYKLVTPPPFSEPATLVPAS